MYTCCNLLTKAVASFPGSPSVQMKNRKKGGQPGKIYYIRNFMNLITCRRTNELAHTLLTEYTRSVAKVLWLTDETRWHYALLAVRNAMVSIHRHVNIRKSH